jgi:hypothetical protein
MEVTFESVIAHPPEKVWALLADFTNLQWLPGPSKVTEGLHDGYPARVLHFEEGTGVDPIVEYLFSVDPQSMRLEYGVVRNPFVPVDGYRAEVNLCVSDKGSALRFTGRFERPEDPEDPEQVEQMLLGAYQLMTTSIDAYLS